MIHIKRVSEYGVYVFDNRTVSGVSVNEELAQELYKSVIKKIQNMGSVCEV